MTERVTAERRAEMRDCCQSAVESGWINYSYLSASETLDLLVDLDDARKRIAELEARDIDTRIGFAVNFTRLSELEAENARLVKMVDELRPLYNVSAETRIASLESDLAKAREENERLTKQLEEINLSMDGHHANDRIELANDVERLMAGLSSARESALEEAAKVAEAFTHRMEECANYGSLPRMGGVKGCLAENCTCADEVSTANDIADEIRALAKPKGPQG